MGPRSCCCGLIRRRRDVTNGLTDGSLDRSLAESEAADQESFAREAWDLLKLASMMFLGRASFSIMKATDSSLLGYTGKQYLEAVSLSDLWTSSIGVFISGSTASVFCANAIGAGNKLLVGVWIQVAYVVLGSVCLFVALSWCFTGPVLRAFGKNEQLANDAEYFALVMMICLPVRIAFSQLNIFFTAQKIVKPGSLCATLSMLSNLLFGMIFVRGIPIPGFGGFGFHACPWVTTIIEYGQFSLFWFYTVKLRRLHVDCWPGWSWDHVTKARVKEYLGMYVYQSLSLASDFWRVSALGVIASGLGDINVAVWNTSYRICWIVLIFSSCLAGAMSLKIGISLGAGRAAEAKNHARIGVFMSVVALCVLCISVACFPRFWGRIFSNDEEILGLFEESRFTLTAFVGLMNLAVVLERIPLAVGRPRMTFWMGVVGSWCGQVPGALLSVKYWRADLVGLYLGSAAGYGLLCMLLAAACCRFDWDELVAEARARSGARQEAPAAQCQSLQERDEGEGSEKAAA